MCRFIDDDAIHFTLSDTEHRISPKKKKKTSREIQKEEEGKRLITRNIEMNEKKRIRAIRSVRRYIY